MLLVDRPAGTVRFVLLGLVLIFEEAGLQRHSPTVICMWVPALCSRTPRDAAAAAASADPHP